MAAVVTCAARCSWAAPGGGRWRGEVAAKAVEASDGVAKVAG